MIIHPIIKCYIVVACQSVAEIFKEVFTALRRG